MGKQSDEAPMSVAAARATVERIVRQYGSRFVFDTIATVPEEARGHVTPEPSESIRIHISTLLSEGKGDEIQVTTTGGQRIGFLPNIHEDAIEVRLSGPIERYSIGGNVTVIGKLFASLVTSFAPDKGGK